MGKQKWKPATLLRRAVFFVGGSLLVGFLIVLFERLLSLYLPRHFAVTLAVGLAVASGLWMMKLVKHPPYLLKRVSPLVAGFCAALGVHLARVWLR